MRDPKRIYKFCNELAEIWVTQCPDWRFGQLMVNVFSLMEAEGIDPFFSEEDEMLKLFKKYFKIEDEIK